MLEEFAGKRAVIHLTGRLDATSANRLKSMVQGSIQKGFIHLVFNMDEVSFIDSSGLSTLVVCLKEIQKQQGTMVLASVGEKIKVALQLSRLNQVFTLYDEIPEALASLPLQLEVDGVNQSPLLGRETTKKISQNPLFRYMRK